MLKVRRAFICCYCGVEIVGSEFNINRYKKIHEKLIKKLNIASEIVDQHSRKNVIIIVIYWMSKYKEETIPDGFKHSNEKAKPLKLCNKVKSKFSETSSSISNELWEESKKHKNIYVGNFLCANRQIKLYLNLSLQN